MSVLEDPMGALIEQRFGSDGIKVASHLVLKGRATDDEIAAHLAQKPSFVRMVLYNLYDAGIATFDREKDKETGWLTFYWRLDLNRLQQMATAKEPQP